MRLVSEMYVHLFYMIRWQGAKSRLKQVELRTLVAHVYRCFADGLRPGSLRSDAQLRSRVLDFIADTLKHLASPSLGNHPLSLLSCPAIFDCIFETSIPHR